MASSKITLSTYPQFMRYFHTTKFARASCIHSDRAYASNQRKRDLPEGESRQGLSRGPATELTRRSGNWMLTDGTEKALTTSGVTEEFGERGPQGSQVLKDSETTIVCGLEAEPGLQKIGKKGRDLEREIAPSLLCAVVSFVVTAQCAALCPGACRRRRLARRR